MTDRKQYKLANINFPRLTLPLRTNVSSIVSVQAKLNRASLFGFIEMRINGNSFKRQRSLYFHVSQINLAESVALKELIRNQIPCSNLILPKLPLLQPWLAFQQQQEQP